MPTLEVYLPAGHAEQRKAQLIGGLTEATVKAIGAPAESVRILLSELADTHYGIGGKRAWAWRLATLRKEQRGRDKDQSRSDGA